MPASTIFGVVSLIGHGHTLTRVNYAWPLFDYNTGNSTLAALTAVCAANMVLILYIIASLREDQESITSKKSPGESRKDR